MPNVTSVPPADSDGDKALDGLVNAVNDLTVDEKKSNDDNKPKGKKETKVLNTDEKNEDEAEEKKTPPSSSSEQSEEDEDASDNDVGCIQSVSGRSKANGDDEEEGESSRGVYLAKGPMRNNTKASNATSHVPYAKPGPPGTTTAAPPSDLDLVTMGHFLDEIYPELNLEQLSPTHLDLLEPSSNNGGGIPGLPDQSPSGVNQLLMSTIDDVFCSGDAGSGSRIIVRNTSEKAGFTLLPTPLSFVIDEYHNRMGINIPKTALPAGAVGHEAVASGKMEIYIQLDPQVNRIIKVEGNIEQQQSRNSGGHPYWALRSQFLRLQPFSGRGGLEALLSGVSQEDLAAAANLLANKTTEDLLKTYQGDFTVLMTLMCQPETPALKAQILMVTKKLLSSTDPSVRKNVTSRNASCSALELAALQDKPDIAAFLTEVFYDMGEDLNHTDEHGNTLVHLLARKGDDVADALQRLLSLRFHGDRKVFATNLRTTKGEMAIHIAAKNPKCHQRIIQLLSQDLPGCFSATTADGSLPIHYSCQYSRDPTLIATLLYYDRSVVNAARKDGFTPLLLVAARGEAHDVEEGLLSLDEETQVRMVRMLLEHGADKTVAVAGHLPVNLVVSERARVKLLLKLRRGEGSRNSSPTSGSPNNEQQQQQPRNDLDAAGGGQPTCNAGQTMINNLGGDYMTSPAASSGFGDMSPHTTISSTSGSPPITGLSQQAYQYENSPSVGSAGVGGGESGSDNEEGGNNSNGGNIDAIAGVLFQHPSIQMALNDSLSNL